MRSASEIGSIVVGGVLGRGVRFLTFDRRHFSLTIVLLRRVILFLRRDLLVALGGAWSCLIVSARFSSVSRGFRWLGAVFGG
ncbi:hypothetical protein L2E82_19924 [Cichorium intybus]|uniref:Uncharacterized protein n=1 Tax=Cichorium intybus TaxID=13427 RepID=A0ACB9DRW5_CICIN|nr:hypothetical protein L2E82_19924 [Cichorium intybus]